MGTLRLGGAGRVKEKVAPFAFLRLDPDAASVTLYDLLANGKTKSRALVLVPGVQPLEDG